MSQADRDKELAYLEASQLTRLFSSRNLSPVEVAQATLRRVERHQPRINAFVLVDADAALDAARASEQRYLRGAALSPLDGVCVSLKDLLLTRGWPTRRGSKTVPSDGPWLEDSPAAARLREAGAVLLGKTTTSEFGLKGMGDSPLSGITRNPWHPAHTPGGSSAGAVAAVAAGLGALAVGTDGGGSIRVPAGYSGVVGLKPSFGRVPAYPSSMLGAPPHVGPIARSVRDARLLLDVLARSDDRDPYRLPPTTTGFAVDERELVSVRVGYPAAVYEHCHDSEVRDAFEAALRRCRARGLEPTPIELSLGAAGRLLTTLFEARAAHTLSGLAPERRGLVDPAIRAAAERGQALGLLDYLNVEAERTALAQSVALAFRDIDVLLTPTTAEPAPAVDAEPARSRAPFAGLFSLTRQPAISIPNGRTRAGLPLGLQIAGRHFEEAIVLGLAGLLEETAAYQPPPEA